MCDLCLTNSLAAWVMSVVTGSPKLLSISEPRESEIAISTYEQTYRNFTTNKDLRVKAAIAMHVLCGWCY